MIIRTSYRNNTATRIDFKISSGCQKVTEFVKFTVSGYNSLRDDRFLLGLICRVLGGSFVFGGLILIIFTAHLIDEVADSIGRNDRLGNDRFLLGLICRVLGSSFVFGSLILIILTAHLIDEVTDSIGRNDRLGNNRFLLGLICRVLGRSPVFGILVLLALAAHLVDQIADCIRRANINFRNLVHFVFISFLFEGSLASRSALFPLSTSRRTEMSFSIYSVFTSSADTTALGITDFFSD